MYAKIEISGILEVKSGLHIGSSTAFAAIGSVDAPVIRDVRTSDPMIPGSSIKGKMRMLLAKCHNACPANTGNDDADAILRLFGSARKDYRCAGRLLFSDMYLTEKCKDELRRQNIIRPVEIKFENTVRRLTGIATTRQIERIIRGTKFGMSLIYEVDEECSILEDFQLIREGLDLLRWDYLGGSGSRGYGKVDFTNLVASVVVGELDDTIIDCCNEILTA